MIDYLEEACEQIDAAMFSGDPFDDLETRKKLREYMGRWTRAIYETDYLQLKESEENANNNINKRW